MQQKRGGGRCRIRPDRTRLRDRHRARNPRPDGYGTCHKRHERLHHRCRLPEKLEFNGQIRSGKPAAQGGRLYGRHRLRTARPGGCRAPLLHGIGPGNGRSASDGSGFRYRAHRQLAHDGRGHGAVPQVLPQSPVYAEDRLGQQLPIRLRCHGQRHPAARRAGLCQDRHLADRRGLGTAPEPERRR